MTRLLSIGALLAVTLMATGCDSGGDSSFDIADYVGTYTGTVKLALTGEPTTTTPVTVTVASSSTTAASGSVTVTFVPQGSGPLVLTGTYDESGAVFPIENSTLVIRVDEDGDVSGTGTLPFFDVTLRAETDGRITSSRFNLSADVTVTEGSGTVDVGTKGTITFDARRASGT